MKVFDFDNTLYRGESAADLFFFMIKRNRKLKKHLPVILINLVKYKLCLVDKDKLESAINGLMKAIIRSREELLAVTADFWRENSHKLNPGILRYMAPEDAVITASPRFLIEGIRDRLPAETIVCSEVDLDRKCVTWFNFGENKVKRYNSLCGDRPVSCFFTDSYNDRAMMKLAGKVFLVRKGRIVKKLNGRQIVM